MEQKKNNQQKPKLGKLNNVSNSIMDWLGSVPSLIVHTIFFASSFALIPFGIEADKVLLVVTTLVSLEAIYMAIFIQMAVNKNNQSLEEMGADLDEIQEDVDEIQKGVEEISEDVDEIQKDVDEIQEDVDEIQKDVDEIQEDVEEISDDKEKEETTEEQNIILLEKMQDQLQILLKEIESLKTKNK